MNLNDLAKEICLREEGKKEVTIAQVKEILRVLGDLILEEDMKIFGWKIEDVPTLKGNCIIDKIGRSAVRRAKKNAKKKTRR